MNSPYSQIIHGRLSIPFYSSENQSSEIKNLARVTSVVDCYIKYTVSSTSQDPHRCRTYPTPQLTLGLTM